MNRIVLALLVAVMLSLTSYLAYATLAPNDPTGTCPSTNAAVTECPAAKPSCCTEECPTATAVETPACCKDKANCCETKGEAGTAASNRLRPKRSPPRRRRKRRTKTLRRKTDRLV